MRRELVAAIATVSTSVVAIAPAAATPMFPLAPPACQSYKIVGFSAIVTNGEPIDTAWAPEGTGGKANVGGFGSTGSQGELVGGLTGTHADFTIVWTRGPQAGFRDHFIGDVQDDLILGGTWTSGDTPRGGWHMNTPVQCIGGEATANKPLGTATVVADTDIYDKPDGQGQKIGTLHVGEEYPLMEPCRDDWCRVGTIELGGYEGLPNGTAWVYSKGFLTFS